MQQMRRDYTLAALDEDTVHHNPFMQFAAWFREATDAGIDEPNAMTLATSTPDGIPSARIVLLKGADENGFTFYTNYTSQKSHDLLLNPCAALLFFWGELQRQVRISGRVEKCSREESEAYFRSRPAESRIGAIASAQSSVLQNRAVLEERFRELTEHYAGTDDIPMPDTWGGWRLIPASFEFWQGRASRLHDRLHFTLQDDGTWMIERLSP